MAKESVMKRSNVSLSKYISQNFTKSFLTVFLPLFFIGSLVFIVKISSLTALFQVNFLEMMKLFSYNIPAILFYTLPISFLVAVATTLLRLSTENELIALISLGVKSKQLIFQIKIIAIIFSTLLLLLSLAKMPQAKQQFKLFQAKKISHAKLNINASQLGQKFGNFFIYVKSKERDTMKDVVIYKKGEEPNSKELSNQLFIAKEATIKNENSSIQLTLKEGSGYTFADTSLKEILYQKMQIFQNIESEGFSYNNIVEHWIKLSYHKRHKRKILFFIFISLIPIMAFPIVASFAIINPRYQKNYAYHILGATIVTMYMIATFLKNQGDFMMLGLFIIGTSLISHLFFNYKVSSFF
jgi:lipopolysaccharide export system permease protein